ncbi:MAG: hypothetical protein RLY86_3280 [Pseudomonadota bacterium]|jgi:hypothetical protein
MSDRSNAARLLLVEAPESTDVPPAPCLSAEGYGITVTPDPAVVAWVRWVAANEAIDRLADAGPDHDSGDDPEMRAWSAAEDALLEARATTVHGLLAKADFALTGQASDDDYQHQRDRALLQIAAGLASLGAVLPGGPWFARERADIRARAGLPAETMIAGILPANAGRA